MVFSLSSHLSTDTWAKGMANERIVTTVIYYYDSENIEGDELMFRQGVSLVSVFDS
jgi:hypothetical protein